LATQTLDLQCMVYYRRSNCNCTLPHIIIIYYENRTQGTLKTIKKKKYNRLKSNSRYILHFILHTTYFISSGTELLSTLCI